MNVEDKYLCCLCLKTRFQVSLWLEEIENQVMRTKFDLHNVVMHPTGENMVLAVPTFKEIYPPVLIGDQVEVIDSSVTDSKLNASFLRCLRGVSV